MRLLLGLIACVGVAALAACGGGDSPPPPSPTAIATVAAAASPSPTLTATAAPSQSAETPTPTVAATPTPTATGEPSPAPTPSPTPTKPSPTPTPSQTEAATPTPTPTPAEPVEATPAATPAPLLSAEELGFREIDTEEALAQAGLTFVEYGPGEAVPWEAGLYLLDVETGEVEGWIIPEGDAVEETDRGRVAVGTVTVNVGLSPGNRFLLLTSDGLHDRLTGRTYTWSAGRLWPVLANYGADLVGWVLPDGERLIFRRRRTVFTWWWTAH